MASVNFEKFHTAQDVKAVIKHCDKEERKKTNHSNADIQKNITDRNLQIDRDYKTTCKLYDDTLKDLDSKENANKRKDRVTCFGLDIPFPVGLPANKQAEATQKIIGLIHKQYPECVLLNAYVHRDEIHDYTDAETKQKRTSLPHGHFLVMPIKNGALNGKWFSSKSNMTKLNNAIHQMYENDYGVQFMDGSKMKSKKSVERLKSESYEEEQKQKTDELNHKLVEIDNLRNELLDELDNLDEQQEKFDEECRIRLKKVEDKEKDVERRENALNGQIRALEYRSEDLDRREREMVLKEQEIEEKQQEDVIGYMQTHTIPIAVEKTTTQVTGHYGCKQENALEYIQKQMRYERNREKLEKATGRNSHCGLNNNHNGIEYP